MLLIFICFALCVFILCVSESTMSLADDKEAGAFGPAVREQKIKNLTKYPLYRPPGWHIVVTSRLSHCQKRFIYMHVSIAEFVYYGPSIMNTSCEKLSQDLHTLHMSMYLLFIIWAKIIIVTRSLYTSLGFFSQMTSCVFIFSYQFA